MARVEIELGNISRCQVGRVLGDVSSLVLSSHWISYSVSKLRSVALVIHQEEGISGLFSFLGPSQPLSVANFSVAVVRPSRQPANLPMLVCATGTYAIGIFNDININVGNLQYTTTATLWALWLAR